MDLIVLIRIGERLTLTTVVLAVSFVVMRGFWRSVQKIDFKDSGKGIGGTVVFSTPVFVRLAIILSAWVSLEHPVSVGPQSPAEERVAAGDGSRTFIGSIPLAGVEAADGHGRVLAERRLRSLNCLAKGQDLGNRTADDLADVKLGLILPYWQADWGDADAFADWAGGRTTALPDPEALAVWEGVHPLC
jgi:hypothetical protein